MLGGGYVLSRDLVVAATRRAAAVGLYSQARRHAHGTSTHARFSTLAPLPPAPLSSADMLPGTACTHAGGARGGARGRAGRPAEDAARGGRAGGDALARQQQ